MTTSATPQPKTLSQMLGEVVWLMTQSPAHKQLFVGDLEWFCMPALLLEQFRVFYGPNSPAVVAFWANVTEETEQRLLAGSTRLRPDEWNAGDRPWLIDLVAPFGGEDEVLKDLASVAFGGKPFKFHRNQPDGRRVVVTYDASSGGLAN